MKGILIMAFLTPLFVVALFSFSTTKYVIPVPPSSEQKIAPKPSTPRPGSKVVWSEFKPLQNLKNPKWGDFLTDIENHADPKTIDYYRVPNSLTSECHEISHSIHAYLNNKYFQEGNYHFYVGDNKYVKIKRPRFKISDVARMIPKSLQKSRYNLYLIQQQKDWNEVPIYLFDEWNAYINGATCGVELLSKKLSSFSKNDSALAIVEFSVYATYVGIAQEKHAPEYKDNNFTEFLAFNLERGMKVYKSAQKFDGLNWDGGEYLKHLQTNEDAKIFRDYLKRKYGKDWCKEVFGF